MTVVVRVLRRAQRDLEEIDDYINREAPAHADALVDALYTAIESLATHPQRGARPRDAVLRAAGYRFLVHGAYLIFYKVAGRTVRVYRVLHGRRAYRGIL